MWWKQLPAAICLAAMIGCQAESGLTTYPVSGTVTYQGKPLEKGRISFVPDVSQLESGPTCACEIIAGKFTGDVTPGWKKVEIYGSWESDRTIQMDDGSGRVKVRDSVPSKYNEQSKLETNIEAQPNDGLNFDLE